MRRTFALFCMVAAISCQPGQAGEPRAPRPSAESDGQASEAQATVGEVSSSAARDGTRTPHPLDDGRLPDEARALPRLEVRHVGLHVGGGTGTSGERTALLEALEARERGILRCYRFVERPGGSGTFGADLYVATAGGHPEIRALRHKLGGADFETCMNQALTSVVFGAQARPIVVSYSLRFELSP